MSGLAPTPPMGWNSWDCFGGSVTEEEVWANATFMADRLMPYGWDTVVVDIQWYEPDPGTVSYDAVTRAVLDAHGRQVPDPGRFPSSADGRGFTTLAGRVHGLGLKFGVHLMRGISRRAVSERLPLEGSDLTLDQIADTEHVCAWNPDMYGVKPEYAQVWYDSVARLLAQWGVDYVKFDDVLYPPIERADIVALHTALVHSGRDVVLSLSPGRQLSLANAEFLQEFAEVWRVSDDLWDDWPAVVEQFHRAARWAPFQGPGSWGDLDMLPMGRIGIRAHVGDPRDSALTLAEQRTMISLWCFARSPLMFGGHLPETRPETIELLTCQPVLDIGLHGRNARELIRDGHLIVWAATVGDAEVRGVFNLADSDVSVSLHVNDLGVAPGVRAEDLWVAAPARLDDGWIRLSLEPHGCAVIGFGPGRRAA